MVLISSKRLQLFLSSKVLNLIQKRHNQPPSLHWTSRVTFTTRSNGGARQHHLQGSNPPRVYISKTLTYLQILILIFGQIDNSSLDFLSHVISSSFDWRHERLICNLFLTPRPSMREKRERKVPRLKKVSLNRYRRKSLDYWQLQTALRSMKDLQITLAALDQPCTYLCREEYCVTKSEAFAVVTEQQTPERTRPMSRTASLRKAVMG